MGISVCGVNVPIIDTVNLEGNPPTQNFLDAGNYAPTGYSLNFTNICNNGVIIGYSHVPKDIEEEITNTHYIHDAMTGFINGGYIEWLSVLDMGPRVECQKAIYGRSGSEAGRIEHSPNFPSFSTHGGYDNDFYFYMAAIKCIYSNYPSSPTYFCVIAGKTIRYNDDGTINTITYTGLGNGVAIHCSAWERAYGVPEDIEEIPDEEDDPAEDPSNTGGYGGTHDDSSDPIGLPSDPAIGITNAGFINIYNPSINGLRGLGDEIFPSPQSATDMVEAIIKFCQQFAYSRLIDYIIDCHVIPCTPTVGNTTPIKVGFVNTTISAPVVTSDYVNVSCGSLSLAEFFGNFADYSLTTAKLWLPFVGFVDVKSEFWQAGTIYVDYKFNIIDGSFMAYVRSTSSKSKLTGSVIASYGGNACMHFPITGVNYANMVSGMVGAATTMASGGTGAVGKGAFTALEAFSRGGDTQQSNGYNSTSAILGIRTPYLIIERVSPSWSALYQHDKGIPSNVAVQLQLVSGYTEIEDIDLTGIPLTKTETDELKQLLTEGVYF